MKRSISESVKTCKTSKVYDCSQFATLSRFHFKGLTEMRAVKDQREEFWQLSSDFAQRLKVHLIDIFQRHVSSVVPLCCVCYY